MKRIGGLVAKRIPVLALATAWGVLGGAAGCGKASDALGLTKDEAKEGSPEEVSVGVSLVDGVGATKLASDGFGLDDVAFALQQTSAANFSVKSCASGYQRLGFSAGAGPASVRLYKHDRGCEAELNSFSVGSDTYVPQSGTGLGGVAGSTAIYQVAATPSKQLRVRVEAQLPAQLSSDGAIASFLFEQLVKGAAYAVSNYTFSNTLTVSGLEAPNLAVADMQLVDIDTAGKASFAVTFTCGKPMTQVGADWSCPTEGGDDALVKNLDMLLITDTFTPAEPAFADVATVFSGNVASLVALSNASKVSGVNSVTTTVKQVTGPLNSNKTMLLVVRGKDPAAPSSGSFRYFNVTIGEP